MYKKADSVRFAIGLNDLVDGIKVGGADAVLAASIFHYGEYTIGQAKAAMAAAGLEMRSN